MKTKHIYHWLKILFFILFTAVSTLLYADDEMKLLSDSLHKMIEMKPSFVQKKEQQIIKIKNQLVEPGLTLDNLYKINNQLYSEYKKFNVDSAIHYMDKNLILAQKLNNSYYRYQSSLQLSLLYSMCGRFRDAELILLSIKSSELPESLLPVYYDAYSRYWEYYSISTAKNSHASQIAAFQDSLKAHIDHSSFAYKLSCAYYYSSRDSVKAEQILTRLLATEEAGTPDYAMLTHSFAMLYRYWKNDKLAQKYLMMSAISDIRNATRETASLQALALMQYEKNNLSDAFIFTQAAIDDVVSSGIHFRAIEIYKFYSIINTAYQREQAKSKSNLEIFLISASIALFLLIILFIFIYLQMKKTLNIKRALAESNAQLLNLNNTLNVLNGQLNDKNDQLSEINDIKEFYIAQFFDVCFSYIHKMEKYQSGLYKIAANKSYDELIKKLKSSSLIDEELNALYARFDTVFLNLYPTFISDFNNLLKEEERLVLKPDILLNRELRIYALLRLGITDSGKIANFLRCSTSTVYNYRTKMRNKAATDRDNFESKIMNI